MGDTNLGNIYYTVGMKGIADAKKQLAELSEAIKKGAISGPMPTAADFANKDAIGEKFANSIMEKTKQLQSSLEKALRASDQKTAARINSELRKLEGIDPTKGSSAIFFAKTSGYSADFVGKLEKAVAETARKAFESASKQLANEMAQQSERANRFGAGIKFKAPAAPLAGGGVASQSFGDPGRYVPGGPRYGTFPDSGQFGQYVRPPRPAGQLAGGLSGAPGGPLFGVAPVAVSGVAGTRKVLVTANELSDVFNAGLSVRSRRAPGGSGGSGEFAEGVGNILQSAITGRFRRLDLQPTVDRTIVPASELARRKSGAGSKDYFGEGLDDFAAGLFGEGGRNTPGSGARRVIEEMFGEGVFGDIPSAVTSGSRRRIGRRIYRPGKSGNGNYPYNGTFGEGAYDDPLRPVAVEPENTEPYGPDPVYGPNAPSYYGLPGGPTYRGSAGSTHVGSGFNGRLNPWLREVDRTRRREGHRELERQAGLASETAGEISGQVFNYDINMRLRDANTAVERERRRPGSTGSDLMTRQNELVDMQEKSVHLAGRRAEIEQRVNSYLGTQVDYSHKIAMEEEAAVNFAAKRLGRELTQTEERGIREDTRRQSAKDLIGGDAADTSQRLSDINKQLGDARTARANATTDTGAQFDKRIRNLREEAGILVRREQLLRRQAELENDLASGGGSWVQRLRARRELGRVGTELEQNSIQGENARRRAAGQRSRNANYRMQELSYGAQDFAQVLSGGGGLDAALRAANNNISQFFAAAGGPNAARYSLMATGAILGIAGALKMMSDSADAPNKKLEEFIARTKELQAVGRDIRGASKGGIIGFGEIGGAGASSGRIGDLEAELRDAKTNLGGAAELFAGRSQDTYAKMFAQWGRSLASLPLGGGFSAAGREMQSMGNSRFIDMAFFERFSQGKSADQITKPEFGLGKHDQRQMEAILGSAGTSPEDAAKAFAAIKDMGGWSDRTAEELKAMMDEIHRVRDIHKKLEYAADSYRLAMEETAANLKRRNELLSGAGGQTQLGVRGQDFAFVNQQNAMARQFDQMAKMARGRGDVDIAKAHEESARKARGEADMRVRGIAPGGAALLTGEAASLEGILSPFNQQIQDAQQAQRDAAFNKAAGRDKRTGADLLGAKQEVAIADEIKRKEVEAAKQRVDDAKARVAATDNLNGHLRGTHETALKELEAAKDEHKRVSENENPNQRKARVRAERARELVAEGMSQEAAGRRADWEAKEQEKKAREGRNFATRRALEGLGFGGPKVNQNYAEAQREFTDSVAQMRAMIVDTYNKDVAAANGDAVLIAEADRVKNEAEKKVAEAEARKKQEDKLSQERYVAQLRYEASATSQNELEFHLKSIEERRQKEIRKAQQDLANPAQAIADIDARADREVRAAKMAKDRKDRDLDNIFSDQAASLVGGRRQQEYENMRKLEENLKQIEEGVNTGGMNPAQATEARRRAQLLYDETDKQINRKGFALSDIGSSWKTIQMSLRPEKSVELQKMMTDHMLAIKLAVADKQGLLVRLPVGP